MPVFIGATIQYTIMENSYDLAPTGDEIFDADIGGHFFEKVAHWDGLEARNKMLFFGLESRIQRLEPLPQDVCLRL